MTRTTRVAACVFALSALAGCGTTSNDHGGDYRRPADDGLSGSPEQFNQMTSPCIAQAARMTGLSQGSIRVLDQIRTGGGPLLTLDVGGTKYSCRLEDDGRVTVFSEFAN